MREGEQLQLAGEVDRAIALFTKSLSVFETAEAHTMRGGAYRFQNRLDSAVEECRRAIAVDPSYGNAYNDLGSYLVAMGSIEEAIEWLERAKEAPRSTQRHSPYMNLGRIFAAKGLHIRALREFEGALRVCPGEPTCLAAIEFLRTKLG